MTHAINIDEKLNQFTDHWNPRIIAELNGQMVKLAKLKGEFIWHSHKNEDELFYVLKGDLSIEFRDRVEHIQEGEMIVIPKGVEHRPVAIEEVHIMLFEPSATINTGQVSSDLTRPQLDKI
jgi:mannose-6-phosphate isomerase-like protein (cupin superfamily)